MTKDKEKLIFPKEDFKRWAGDIGGAAVGVVNEVVGHIKDAAEEQEQKKLKAKYNKRFNSLNPVFQRDFAQVTPISVITSTNPILIRAGSTPLPNIIHIVEKDKKHAESPICADAVGHISVENDLPVLNIYPEYVKQLGIRFYPDTQRSVYYVDPFQKSHYIDIDEYFEQQKTARVRELEQIAYDLGATHVEIIFKTKTVESEHEQKKAGIGAKMGSKKAEAKAEHEKKEKQEETIEVCSVLELGGHNNPHEPELIYFKRDPDIQKLIFMRMDPKSTLKKKEYSIKYSKAAGIKTKDAAKIQGAIMKMGGSADVSLMEEATKESHTTLIYKIEFANED